MGTNTLPTAVSGTTIPPSDHNAMKEALGVDLVPRNASGVVVTESGSLGSATFRWLNIFLKKGTLVLDQVKPRTKTTDGTDPGEFGFCRSSNTSSTVLTSPAPADAVIAGSTMSLSVSSSANPVRVTIDGRIVCRSTLNTDPGGELSLFRDTQASYATETRIKALIFQWTAMNSATISADFSVSDNFEVFDDTVSASTTYFYRWKLQDNFAKLNQAGGQETFLYFPGADTANARCYEIV